MPLYSITGIILSLVYGVPALLVVIYSFFCSGFLCGSLGLVAGSPLVLFLSKLFPSNNSDTLWLFVSFVCVLIQALVLFVAGYFVEKIMYGDKNLTLINYVWSVGVVIVVIVIIIFAYLSFTNFRQ